MNRREKEKKDEEIDKLKEEKVIKKYYDEEMYFICNKTKGGKEY